MTIEKLNNGQLDLLHKLPLLF